MTKIIKALAAIAILAGPVASAQDTGVDLSSQRHELRGVNPVGGSRVARTDGTTVISPTPREMNMSESQFLLLGDSWKLSVPKELRHAVPRLTVPEGIEVKSGKTNLTVKYGDKAAERAGVPDRAEAYRLVIDRDGVRVTGRDSRGALYGLQTLARILEGPYTEFDMAPFCDITDWPELPRRGLVEGFYGPPWSHETRLALIDFLGDNKMNTYIYGPKDDPYHSSPNWRLPYPPDQAAKIRELASRARSRGVDFIWAIHPGKDIRWDRADRDSLLMKFEAMYDLGVRGFAIFFDDIEGAGTDPRRQTELLNDLNRAFVASHKDVAPLSVCPTEYSRGWINPRPGGANDIYGQTLDKEISVFYTGNAVCSDITLESLHFMSGLIRRPPYFWWNFPVTDYCRNFLLQGPVYGLAPEVTVDDCTGVVSNPMEHGIASMPALYQLADYTWNPAAYNPLDSWERSLAAVAGKDAAEAYRAFAINSADTKTGYRRDESWEMPREAFSLPLDSATAAILARQFDELGAAPAALRDKCTNEALIGELSPWLDQAELLAGRLKAALALATSTATDTTAAGWRGIAAALPTASEARDFETHTLGTLRLVPFIETATERSAAALYEALTGHGPAKADSAACAEDLGLRSSDPFILLQPDWLRVIDGSLTTSTVLDSGSGAVIYDLPAGTAEIVILTGKSGTDLTAGWVDGTGSAMIFNDITAPVARLGVPPGAKSLRLAGDATLHEIIPITPSDI